MTLWLNFTFKVRLLHDLRATTAKRKQLIEAFTHHCIEDWIVLSPRIFWMALRWERGVPRAPSSPTLLHTVAMEAPRCIVISPVMRLLTHSHIQCHTNKDTVKVLTLEICCCFLRGWNWWVAPYLEPQSSVQPPWHTHTPKHAVHLFHCLFLIGCTCTRQWEWQEFTLLQSARARVCHIHHHLLPNPQAFPCPR